MNFSTEHWASHTRGQKKRAEILVYLSKHPDAKPEELAQLVNLSIYQVKRHLSTIHLERGIKSLAVACVFAICSIPTVSHWYLSLSNDESPEAIAFLENKNLLRENSL